MCRTTKEEREEDLALQPAFEFPESGRSVHGGKGMFHMRQSNDAKREKVKEKRLAVG